MVRKPVRILILTLIVMAFILVGLFGVSAAAASDGTVRQNAANISDDIAPSGAQALSASNITLYSASVEYNGKQRTPSITVKNSAGTVLTKGTDYTVTVPSGRTNVGTYTYKITGIGKYSGTITKYFKITPQPLSASRATLYAESVEYNGKQRTPSVTVTNAAGNTLIEGKDYTVTVPSGRTNAGTYVYKITGKGNYSGTVSKNFVIKAQPLSASRATLYSASVEYNGKQRTPSVTVKNAAGDVLTSGTDYTVTVPSGRTKAGTYVYKITGKGNYSGTVSKNFVIKAQPLSASRVTLYAASVEYNGKQRTPTVTVKNAAGTALTAGTDYTVTVPSGRTKVGTYTYKITGKGNYSGTISKAFKITPQPLSASRATLYAESVEYNGKQRTPTVTVKNAAGTVLTAGTDYTVTVPSGRTKAGTYVYKITGKGNYSGTVSKSFVIKPQPLSASRVTLYSASVEYNGKQRTPTVTVKNAAGTVLSAGTDYTVTVPSGRTKVGTYTYKITGKGNYSGTISKAFKITAQPLSASRVTFNASSVVYNGKQRTPTVTVKNAAGTVLTAGTDYTVTVPSGRTKVGTYTYKITGKGNYSGTVSKNFVIKAQPLSASRVTFNASSVVYNGKQRTPTVTVKSAEGTVLSAGTDYTVTTPSGRTNVGTYTYKITGKGQYSGTVSKNFVIKAQALVSSNISLYAASVEYNGKQRTPSVTVKNSAGTVLSAGTDYTVTTPSGRTNAGTYVYKITGKGNYSGTVSKNFVITAQALASSRVTLSPSSAYYTGSPISAAVTVKNAAGTTLRQGTDYTVTVPSGRTAVGSYTYVVKGIGNYKGSISKVLKIVEVPKTSLTKCTVTLSSTSYTYDGNQKKPTVTVVDGSKTLTQGKDFTVSYSNNTNAGTAKATVTGIGNYKDTVTKSFTISRASVSGATVTLSSTGYDFDGSYHKPTVTVVLSGRTLTKGTDYSVEYSNNRNPGKGKVTVTGIGNYTGTKAATFTINNVFAWGVDNWNFTNSYWDGSFTDTTYRRQINSHYLSVLADNLTSSEYNVIFGSGGWLDEDFGGSCYGMSSLALLSKKGYFPYDDYKRGAVSLYEMNKPSEDMEISSLITYYQMLQVKGVIQQLYRDYSNRSHASNIKEVISLLQSNPCVVVCFAQRYWGGHAILAIGYETGSWTINGNFYDGCIKMCDPNSSTNYDEIFNFYYNSSSYNWTIPIYTHYYSNQYSYEDITSENGAYISLISANAKTLNTNGYLGGTASGSDYDRFIARIDAYEISDERRVTKVTDKTHDDLPNSKSSDDIIETYLCDQISGRKEATLGYNLYDPDSSYKVSQAAAAALDLKMDYEFCDLFASASSGTDVIFDKYGYVQVNGESTDYTLTMTLDDNYPTDWFTLTASGSGANFASLKLADGGYILSSDNLKDVALQANNRDITVTISFSTDCDSVYIYEIDDSHIGLKVDTDGDGVYETDIA